MKRLNSRRSVSIAPRTVALCAAALATGPLAHARQSQTPVYVNQDSWRGQLSALPVGLSIHSASGAGDHVLAKREGDRSSYPMVWDKFTPRRSINYDKAAILGTVTGVDVSIDAWSTGNDLTPGYDGEGRMQLNGSGVWVSISASFSNSTQPVSLPQADLVQQRHSRAANVPGMRTSAGADIFSYYFPYSTGIAPRLVGKTVVEQAAEQIGFGQLDDIDAMDFGMGAFSFEGTTQAGGAFVVRDQLYFSITQASEDDLNNHYGQGGPHFAYDSEYSQTYVAAADAAAVYGIKWDPAQRLWGTPYVYRTAQDLIDPTIPRTIPADDFDVDAIAVDQSSGSIIFSTTIMPQPGPSLPSQVMVSYTYVNLQTKVLKDDHGHEVAKKLGSGDETRDVDATSITDPESGLYATHMGIAISELQLPPGYTRAPQPLGLSIARTGPPLSTPDGGPPVEDGNDETLHIHTTGRTHFNDPGGAVFFYGRTGPGNGTEGTAFSTFSSAWVHLSTQGWDNGGGPGEKDPSRSIGIDVPAVLFGETLYFAVVYVESGTNTLATSYICAVNV